MPAGDYVSWCDQLAGRLADYAEQLPGNLVNLQQFAGVYSEESGATTTSIVLTLSEFLPWFDINPHDLAISIPLQVRRNLRKPQGIWMAAFEPSLTAEARQILAKLNSLSENRSSEFPAIDEIDIEHIQSDLDLTSNDVHDILTELESLGMARVNASISFERYNSTYIGLARTTRRQSANNRELELHRAAGEAEKLDFKRHYKWKSSECKNEFAKDIVAMANTGAPEDGLIILGLENDGSFYRASSESEQEEHELLLKQADDERLQQILNSRTSPSPSISTFHGEHSEGAFVFIRVHSDLEQRPYECTSTGKKVYTRTGSITKEANQDEIDAMEKRAKRYASTPR